MQTKIERFFTNHELLQITINSKICGFPYCTVVTDKIQQTEKSVCVTLTARCLQNSRHVIRRRLSNVYVSLSLQKPLPLSTTLLFIIPHRVFSCALSERALQTRSFALHLVITNCTIYGLHIQYKSQHLYDDESFSSRTGLYLLRICPWRVSL